MTRIAIPITAFALTTFVCYSIAQNPTDATRAGSNVSLPRATRTSRTPQPPTAVGHPGFLSPHASPIACPAATSSW